MIIEGEKYGVQAFMVPVRDQDTHRPLKGIEVGDIGPKFGFQAKDNGYAIFKDVRIPRENLLKRYIDVDKEGCVSMKGNPRILYSIMMATRLALMDVCPQGAACALTIAIRHAISSKNFDNLHLLKTVTVIASHTFAMNFSCHILQAQYNKMMNNIQKKNDFSMLGPLHQVLAGLKALFCGLSFEHSKTLSYMCGELGYHTFAGHTKIID